MASNGSFGVVIKAVDQASATINKINKSLEAMHAPIDRLQSSLKKFANLSGLKAVSTAFTTMAKTIKEVAMSVIRLIPIFGALTAGGIVAGMYRIISAAAEMGTTLLITSQRLGIGTDQLKSLQDGARLAGASSDSLNKSLEGLGDTMQNALSGRNPETMR